MPHDTIILLISHKTKITLICLQVMTHVDGYSLDLNVVLVLKLKINLFRLWKIWVYIKVEHLHSQIMQL